MAVSFPRASGALITLSPSAWVAWCVTDCLSGTSSVLLQQLPGGCLVLWVVDYLTGASIYTGLHLLGGPLIFSGFRLLVGCNRFEPKELMKRVLKWGDSYSYEVYLVHQLLVLGDFSLSIFFPNSPVAVVSLVLVWSLLAGMVLHHVASPLQKTLITRLTTTQEAK